MATRSEQHVSAFADLVEARSTSLLRLAYAVVGDHQLAQDLLQEALVKVYVAWPRLRDSAAAEAYVRRTIVTTAISWRRRRSFHEPPVAVVPDRDDGDETDRLTTHGVLWEQVRELPSRQRAALVLRYYEDLSEAETAELMGCSVGTVKSQVATALLKLRDRVGPGSGVLFPEDEAVTR
ncbi:SigE family RNA polymerase sigma factor [Nocardioides sp. MAHUQ-72]|uniref:SigE family RNA polymerase sigma factor n=1 Tax=unclassified Nocardioides TaxID=2615069 RepID=UPI0036171137